MFKNGMGLALIYSVSAVKIKETREPLLTWAPSAKKSGHPQNYFVPNFGADEDMLGTSKSIGTSEIALAHKLGWTPPGDKPKDPPRNYFVPNFGPDSDLQTTQRNEALAEQALGHTWNWAKDTSKPPPTDYFVPNFGPDRDMAFTQKHISDTESKLGHTWNWAPPAKPHKMGYTVPNFGLDHDINDSLNHLKQNEAQYGHWDLPKDDWFVQTEADREPLLTWAPSAKKGHPVDYFVPNFGMDEDIVSTQGHIKDLEVKFPAFVQTDVEESREPLLTWAPSPKKGHPVDYFVPNFGADENINTTQRNLNAAEDSVGHHWNWAKAGKPHPQDYFVPNFGLDGDMVGTIESAQSTENLLQHHWIPVEKDKHKVNYFVPNFGQDDNIATSQTNEHAAEAALGHSWVLKKDEKTEKFIVPSAEIDFKL